MPCIFADIMEPAPGHFAKVNHNGKTETVLIERLSYHNGKMDYVTCSSFDKLWARGFTPKEIIEVIENPNAAAYLAEQAEHQKRVARYTQKKTTVVKMDYEDGWRNNWD